METDKTAPIAARSSIRALRFHGYGEPAEVLHLEEAPVPSPGANRIRVLTIPIARTFPLEEWRDAMEISMSGKASGKLLLLPTTP